MNCSVYHDIDLRPYRPALVYGKHAQWWQEYLSTAGQPVVPSNKVFGRVDTSQPLSWHSHTPVALRPITLQETTAYEELSICGRFLQQVVKPPFMFSPVRPHGRPAAAPQPSHPSPHSRFHRNNSVDAWPSAWMCWWRSEETRRSHVFMQNNFLFSKTH